MNVALIIPTGIGAEIGGHAGDGNPAAKLIGACCDKLFTHPNVVNASDINEMPDNTFYVEGSILDRFLNGQIFLRESFYNKILLSVNPPVKTETINAVNAAISTIGADIEIMENETPLKMKGFYKNGRADGEIQGVRDLCKQAKRHHFDALAIQSPIDVDEETKNAYLTGTGGVNPWGGIEAIASKQIANQLDVPVAHSPIDLDEEEFNEIVDPRMSSEMVSVSYLHCILKGLHRAPFIDYDYGYHNGHIDALVSPYGCIGEPHDVCIKNDIPVIIVKENKTVLNDKIPNEYVVVNNYHEAAGVLMGFRAGVSERSLRRPLKSTKIHRKGYAG